MAGMSQPAADERSVTEYRIPAHALRPEDIVNTAPGGEDDWQQVLSVHTAAEPGSDEDALRLIAEVGDRYVLVRLTDVAPLDSPIYFSGGGAHAYGLDGADDVPVSEVVSEPDTVRNFLYTCYELVTVRS
jgi:hypothetical protein